MIAHVDKFKRRIFLVTGDVIKISKSYYTQVLALLEAQDF